MTHKFTSLLFLCALMPSVASGQFLKSGYVNPGVRGTAFGLEVRDWKMGDKWSEDDNFYISRVRPHKVFRNQATQVNPDLDDSNDKKLLFWVPINEPSVNALPDGKFDSEVFPMWNYVTHYGNWTTSLVRIPGSFSDVAHKNGVAVSCVAGIPYGELNDGWNKALSDLVGAGAAKVADYMEYYGIDGLGYNSEFQGPAKLVQSLALFHDTLVKTLKAGDRMPLVENVWYDGTQITGKIAFDKGLTTNNADIWGGKGKERTSLFFNYNWNNIDLLNRTVNKAKSLNRSPLDIYAGFNMQGSEPSKGERWPLLNRFPISIGLWGAHERNMFWETRSEYGSSEDAKQRAYMERVERWFSSGKRNPVNDLPITNDMNYSAYNHEFPGMSSMMSARSALKWSLDDEPFVTFFNLGNGKFFNWEGVRRNGNPWYNIGIQDYLPTWRWWFADRFLGNDPQNVPSDGLDAEFTWDDAYMGGSLMHVYGSTSAEEYLHLFKTSYKLAKGDVITLRYKIVKGKGDAWLALSVEGDEANVRDEAKSKVTSDTDILGKWMVKKFVVGADLPSLENETLAMVALKFDNAVDLDMRLGELSIIRPGKTNTRPAMPVLETAKLLSSNRHGVDGKVIFHMPNDKAPKVCYNTDVNTSLFILWGQQEGQNPTLMGATMSWAGLMFSIPVRWSDGKANVRLGVQAVSQDFSRFTEITWSDYMVADGYQVEEGIEKDKDVVYPGEAIKIKYIDPEHSPADWEVTDLEGNTMALQKGSKEINISKGLPNIGEYTVKVTNSEGTVTYPSFIQVTPASTGTTPEILTFTAQSQDPEWKEGDMVVADPGKPVQLSYTGKKADGKVSRGLTIGEQEVGFKWADLEKGLRESFTVSFWFKSNGYEPGNNALMNIRDKTNSWPSNQWGWFYSTLDGNGVPATFVIQGSPNSFQYNFANTQVLPKIWHHIAYVFEFDELRVKPRFYVDGIEQECTSWKIGSEVQNGPVTFAADAAGPRVKNALGFGGNIHTTPGCKGFIDQLEFHDHALTTQEVKDAMNCKMTDLPMCRWTFDEDPAEDGHFTSTGTKAVAAGPFSFASDGTFSWREPKLAIGSPFVNELGHEVKTEPIWECVGGKIISQSGNDQAGLATISWEKTGVYDAMLTLKNDYGSDVRQFRVNVGETSIPVIGFDLGDALKVSPNPFRDGFKVYIPGDGDYEFALVDMRGSTVFHHSTRVVGRGEIWLAPPISRGIYILQVVRNGSPLPASKVIKIG